MGWAYWVDDQDDAPTRVGVIPPAPGDVLALRCKAMMCRLPVIDASGIIVCEFPEFQEGSARSMGWRKGDLQKLTFLVGYIAGFHRHHTFVPVKPSTWKGQLPKSIVADRITTRLGQEWVEASGVKTHAWDAVGIGLWFRDLKDTV
jgi:hypothetical protein